MSEPLLSIAEARAAVAAEARPLDSETVPVADALGRVLAEDVTAAGDVPPFANSAMDGFAVTAGPAGRRLRVAGESRAGAPADVAVTDQQGVRISTGAALPAGAGAVVPLERASEDDGWVTLEVQAAEGLNVRAAGEDMLAGAMVLQRGLRLGPAQLGVAVSAGRGELRCARRPRVAILTTGDELREPGSRLQPGEIHNSNLVALLALVRQAGAQPTVARSVQDTPADTQAALADALASCDVVVASGGVSVGPHDHVKAALAALGVQKRFWRVALRPGKPTWFGVRGQTLVYGLPGNPVSAFVTFLLFVKPALEALQGMPPSGRRRLAVLETDVPRQPDRDEAIRVSLREDGQRLLATPTGPQGSHQLTSMLAADALMLVAAGAGSVAAGSVVEVEPIVASG